MTTNCQIQEVLPCCCYNALAVDCGPPVSPVNGYLGNYSSTKEGTNVTFQCNEGYVPSIVRVTTCNSYGLWYPAPHIHNCTLTEGTHNIVITH